MTESNELAFARGTEAARTVAADPFWSTVVRRHGDVDVVVLPPEDAPSVEIPADEPLVDAEVAVHLPGGTLMIAHTAPGSVMMSGPATTIATGTLDRRWLEAAHRGELEVDTP